MTDRRPLDALFLADLLLLDHHLGELTVTGRDDLAPIRFDDGWAYRTIGATYWITPAADAVWRAREFAPGLIDAALYAGGRELVREVVAA
jgi:hypothetical protein